MSDVTALDLTAEISRMRPLDPKRHTPPPTPTHAELTDAITLRTNQLLDLLGRTTTEELGRLTADADEAAAEYHQFKGQGLADTLLVRLGLMTPAEAKAHGVQRHKTRTLKTPSQVITAIAAIANELQQPGTDSKNARARLYALQTMLVAMRMKPELEADNRRGCQHDACTLDACPMNIRQLNAATPDPPRAPRRPDTLLSALENVMRDTIEEEDPD